MKTTHYQFTDAHCVEIYSEVHPSIGPLVRIMQSSASMYFQFDMTPAQARTMAEALVKHVESLEGGAE